MLDLVGIEVLVKLFENTTRRKNDQNKLITRTLGKVGVLNKELKSDLEPQAGEFWKCRIVKETNPGQNTGCFILEPVELVQVDKLLKLLPGMYEEIEESGTLLISPKNPGHCYILPLGIKKNLKRVNAIIVKLN